MSISNNMIIIKRLLLMHSAGLRIDIQVALAIYHVGEFSGTVIAI